MWSRNDVKIAAVAALAALLIPFSSAVAGGGEVEVTDERKSVCAKAEKRFKKAFPDYKVDPGVKLVLMYKYNFCPANITVKAGTTVRWLNVDRRTSHSVWMKEAGIAESERFFPDEIWEHKFTESGPYPYICGPHGEQEKMIGFVKVEK